MHHRRATWLARHKAPNYAARAGQTIAGNLGRGGDGKFVRAGSGGNEPGKPTARQERNLAKQQARAGEAQAEADQRTREDAALDAAKPGKERAKLRAQIARDRRARANARRQARAAEAQTEAQTRAGEAAAPKDPKAEKPKKGGGGGGKAKPSDDEKKAEADKKRQATAAATAQQAGLPPDAPDALRTARDEGGVTNPALLRLGLIDSAGDTTDQGRRALAALERGDIGSYRAALQDASSRLKREALAAKRQAARDAVAAERERTAGREAPTEGAQRRNPRRGQRYVNIPSRKSFAVFKDKSGADRWLAITTTAYRDQDNEYISREALKGAVRWGDRGQERGVLRYWHVPGFDLGMCDFQATTEDDKLLIESGTFNSPAAAALGRRMAAKGWQMSPGFLHPPDEPRDGVYDHILIFERSACPPGRASNPYTRFLTEDTMDDTKLAQLKELTADNPDLLDSLLATATKTNAAATEAGAVYKDAPPWAQALISRLDALEAAKAFPPADVETKADPAAEMLDAVETIAPEMEAMDDGPLFSPADLEAIAGAVLAKIAPLLDVEKKIRAMADEIKGSMGGMATKDDTTAQLAQLDTRLKTLEGEQPAASVYRASQDTGTALPAALVEALKNAPHNITPTGSPQTTGNPVADFLSSFNIGGR